MADVANCFLCLFPSICCGLYLMAFFYFPQCIVFPPSNRVCMCSSIHAFFLSLCKPHFFRRASRLDCLLITLLLIVCSSFSYITYQNVCSNSLKCFSPQQTESSLRAKLCQLSFIIGSLAPNIVPGTWKILNNRSKLSF